MKRFVRQKDTKTFTCPQCQKYRLIRPLDHQVSIEKKKYKISDDQEIELLIDICNWCKERNFKKYFQKTKINKRIAQIMSYK